MPPSLFVTRLAAPALELRARGHRLIHPSKYVGSVASFDRSIDRVDTVDRMEP